MSKDTSNDVTLYDCVVVCSIISYDITVFITSNDITVLQDRVGPAGQQGGLPDPVSAHLLSVVPQLQSSHRRENEQVSLHLIHVFVIRTSKKEKKQNFHTFTHMHIMGYAYMYLPYKKTFVSFYKNAIYSYPISIVYQLIFFKIMCIPVLNVWSLLNCDQNISCCDFDVLPVLYKSMWCFAEIRSYLSCQTYSVSQ